MMTTNRCRRIAMFATACLAGAPALVRAQALPWVVFEDDLSTSVCDLVNAENAELVVLADTGEMVQVSGGDIILDGTFVDFEAFGPPWFVSFFGEPAGLLDFADDGDGFRTLWWLALDGTVVRVDQFNGEPLFSDAFPFDFIDVPCDASPFWDGCLDDSECDDGGQCTIGVCNGGFCEFVDVNNVACNDGDPCTRLDTCFAGVCEGSPIFGCNGDPGPAPGDGAVVINLCGTNAAMALTMTFVGLVALSAGRTRRSSPHVPGPQ